MQKQTQTADTESKLDGLIYDPSSAVSATVSYIESGRTNIEAGLGLQFPIETIAKEYPVPPLLPGKVLTVQAKSHNGKSMFLDFWKADLARRIQLAQRTQDIIISVSAEDMVEEQMAVALMREAERHGERGRVETMDGILLVSSRLGSVPIYYIGASIERSDRDLPPANMSNVARCVFRIIDRRKDKGLDTIVQGLFLDFIQAMPLDPDLMKVVIDKRRHLQVREDFFALRTLAAKVPCPVVCASQSKQNLENAPGQNMLTPGLFDHQETSAVPQHADSDFSLWMPKTSHPYNEVISHGKDHALEFRVLDNLIWLRCNKQRGFDPSTLKRLPAGKAWPLWIDFDANTFSQTTPEHTLNCIYKAVAQKEDKNE